VRCDLVGELRPIGRAERRASPPPPRPRRAKDRPTPTIDLADPELAAVAAAIRSVIEQDRFPLAPRLELLRSALAKLDHAAAASLRRPLTAQKRQAQPTTPKGRPRAS
jgi:hypothetical protein